MKERLLRLLAAVARDGRKRLLRRALPLSTDLSNVGSMNHGDAANGRHQPADRVKIDPEAIRN